MKFATNSLSILPEEPCALSGLQYRDAGAVTLGIQECNLCIAWLQINQDEQLLFFLADLLFFPNHLAGLLEQYLLDEFQIPKTQIIFAGTHNHSGPALGFLPWEKKNLAYEEQIFSKIKTAVAALPQQLKSVKVETEQVAVGAISINRRKKIRHWRTGFARKALMLPNTKGPTSNWMRLVRFIPEGEAPTLFISYASHPVFNRSLSFSSDYPGRVSQLCKEELGVKQVFCFQGFGGDLRPNYQGRQGWKANLKAIFQGPEFADYTNDHLESFCQEIVQAIKNSKADKKRVEGALAITESNFELTSVSQKTKQELTLKKITIGENLKWLLTNAELFCEYQNDLSPDYFPIGCTTRTIGYVPTPDELQWGGYEVADAPLNNAMDGPMGRKGLERVVAYFQGL